LRYVNFENIAVLVLNYQELFEKDTPPNSD
jgi:hypothetical protein